MYKNLDYIYKNKINIVISKKKYNVLYEYRKRIVRKSNPFKV